MILRTRVRSSTWFQTAKAAQLIIWGVISMISSCVVISLGTSFDGGGCLVGLGFLPGLFGIGLIAAGIARAVGGVPRQE